MTPEELLEVRQTLAALQTRIEELSSAIRQHSETFRTAQEGQRQHADTLPEPQSATKKEKENPTDQAARRTATATVWIAIFTVVLALVGCFTLIEVVEGGTDTHTLATAAKTQAEKMKNMSDAADKIRQAAQDMVVQDQRIADNAQKAMEANNEQSKAVLNATVSDFQRDQRAWVGIGQYNIQSFDKQNPFKLVIPFVNSGKTPAVKTEDAIVYKITDHMETDPASGHSYSFEPTSAIAPQGNFAVTVTNSAVSPRYDSIEDGTLFLYF